MCCHAHKQIAWMAYTLRDSIPFPSSPSLVGFFLFFYFWPRSSHQPLHLAFCVPFAHLAFRFVAHATTCATSHSTKLCSMVTRVIYLLVLFGIMQILRPKASNKNLTIAKQFSYNGRNCGQIRSIFYASRKIHAIRTRTAYNQTTWNKLAKIH